MGRGQSRGAHRLTRDARPAAAPASAAPRDAPFLCVGALHWDLVARAAAPLAPGADVPGRIDWRPGGVALNVASALAARGRRAVVLGAVGRDDAGDRLLAAAAGRGIDCAHVARVDGPSDLYLALEQPDGELFAAVADCAGLERAAEQALATLRGGAILAPGRSWPGVAVLDGNLPAALLAALAREPALAGAPRAVVAASPAKAARLAPLAAAGAALYLNRREAEAICGRPLRDAAAAARALRAAGWGEAVVTDGTAPAAHAGPHGLVAAPPPRVVARSVTGAGDAFVAAHLAERDGGGDPETTLAAALAAAGRHVAAASA